MTAAAWIITVITIAYVTFRSYNEYRQWLDLEQIFLPYVRPPMTLQGLQYHWPRTWRVELQQMYREGFVLCLKCDGLPHENFLDAHNAACP